MLVETVQKNEFGNARFYPENQMAHVLLDLMGRKSFTTEQIRNMRAAGFEVKISYPKVEI